MGHPILGFAEDDFFFHFLHGTSNTWGIDEGNIDYFLVVP